jgi:hypothetical protein
MSRSVGHLAEMGIIAAQALKNARELAHVILAEETIPACVRTALARWCGNCMFWIRRSRAAIEPSLRWLETTKWRAA